MAKQLARMDSVTLAHHLRVVSERYAMDAQNLTNEQPQAMARVIREFHEQSERCQKFADALEEGYMRIDGDLLLIIRD